MSPPQGEVRLGRWLVFLILALFTSFGLREKLRDGRKAKQQSATTQRDGTDTPTRTTKMITSSPPENVELPNTANRPPPAPSVAAPMIPARADRGLSMPLQPWRWRAATAEHEITGFIGAYLSPFELPKESDWRRVRGSKPTLVHHDGAQVQLLATRGRVYGAEVSLPEEALGFTVMPVWPLLFGQREAPIELAMGLESMSPGGRLRFAYPLEGGHQAQVDVYFRRGGEPPFGPARVRIKSESLSLDAATQLDQR